MGNTPSDSSSPGDIWDVWAKDDEEEARLLALTRESAGGPGTTSDVVSQTGADGVTGATEQGGFSVPAATPDAEEEGPEPVLDQCGMDPGEWVEVPPPPRIKESRLTAEEQTNFRGHLDRIFTDEAYWGKRLMFDPNDVVEVMEKVIPYLESEPILIEDVPFDIVIVGDLHGQLHDLHHIFDIDAKDGKKGWECVKYLFLGDYVDRGRQSVEIVMALFCLKMLYPDRIFLMRGNHEFSQTNARYGFPLDFHERYSDEETAMYVYAKVNLAFCYLSVGAIVGDTYYCAHGGVSPSGFTRALMSRIKKPYVYCQDDIMPHDVMWGDPAIGLHGSTFDTERGTAMWFGLDELASALDNMDCKGMFRGHTALQKGYQLIGDMCFSLFSCVGQSDNKGATAYVDPHGKVTIRVTDVDDERVEWDAMLLRLDGQVPDYRDVKTKFGKVSDPEPGAPALKESTGIKSF